MSWDNVTIPSNNRPEADQYVHCYRCIEDTGGINGKPYEQKLEVGFVFEGDTTMLLINCRRHDMPITQIKLDIEQVPHAKGSCDFNDGE